MTLDTSNQFAVSAAGDRIGILGVAKLYDRSGVIRRARRDGGWPGRAR